MEIIAKKDILSREDGPTFYRNLLKKEQEGIFLIRCAEIPSEEAREDLFWKDFLCKGSEGILQSPFCLVGINCSSFSRNSYLLEGGCDFYFQLVINVLRSVLNLKKDVSIIRDVKPIGNIMYGRVFLGEDSLGGLPSAVDLYSPETSENPISSSLIAIPSSTTSFSDWNYIPPSLKFNYIKYRLKRIFS